jgi:hypothetical protein
MADQPTIKDKLEMDAKTLWQEHRLFFIIFGAVILLIKFRDIAIDLLVSGGKKTLTNAKKEDASLAVEENKDNAQANQLVEHAKELPAQEEPVKPDWYKDSK